jgi:hypothetical protein
MSHRVFRSPSSGTAAAATAPSLLASRVDGRARWRELPDGAIEVATLDDQGRLERVRVEGDGSTTPLAAATTDGRPWALPTMILGIVLFVGVSILLDSADPDPRGILTVFIGFALIAIGGFAHHGARDIDGRLKRVYGKNAGWHEATNLKGWMPRTAQQLRTVEQLADTHEGVAFVRDVGGKTIEAYARCRDRFEHYWVDENGNAELVESASVRSRFILGRILTVACGGFFLAAFVSGLVVDHHKGLLVIGSFGGIVATMMAGDLNLRRMSVERRIRREKSAGDEWHEIRTWIEEGD